MVPKIRVHPETAMMFSRLTLLVFFFLLLWSCGLTDTPENYFDVTTLNTNKFFGFGAKDFEQMQNLKRNNALYANLNKDIITTDSYEQHVKTYKIPEIEEDIKKIKNLTVTEDTKEMIEASLEVFKFIKSKYETDYLKITKLMDDKAPRKDINAAINQLEVENAPLLDKKINVLMGVALPYAKKNGIEVTTY